MPKERDLKKGYKISIKCNSTKQAKKTANSTTKNDIKSIRFII